MSNAAFKELLTRYLNDTISVEELHELLQYLQKHESAEVVKQAVEQALQNNTFKELSDKNRADIIFENIMQQAQQAPPAEGETIIGIGQRKIALWVRWAAAAAVVLMVAGGAYYFLLQKAPRPINVTAQKKQPPAGDRAPGGNKAYLQLADGSTITLDDSATGMLAQQGATKILKLNNGQLQYNSSTQANAPVLYNTISTPRGGQYHVILPDGSKVWLNAASSLRFPTAFQGNTRMVQLTGEAYFEVVHNSRMPFKVSVPPPPGGTGGAEVEVLGTHFNVMGYDNENIISTTLLEGSVRVSSQAADKGSPVLQLKAGQQANLHKGSSVCKVQEVDTEAVVAWKNGMFQFNSADIPSIMRQIERWYDVEVIYKGRIPEGHYSGIVPRDNNLLKVLRIFEESDLKFTIEGKKLSVL